MARRGACSFSARWADDRGRFSQAPQHHLPNMAGTPRWRMWRALYAREVAPRSTASVQSMACCPTRAATCRRGQRRLLPSASSATSTESGWRRNGLSLGMTSRGAPGSSPPDVILPSGHASRAPRVGRLAARRTRPPTCRSQYVGVHRGLEWRRRSRRSRLTLCNTCQDMHLRGGGSPATPASGNGDPKKGRP